MSRIAKNNIASEELKSERKRQRKVEGNGQTDKQKRTEKHRQEEKGTDKLENMETKMDEN